MSMAAITWARKCRTGSASAKAVLMALADRADDDGKAWPSQGDLADYTELTERTVRSALDLLVTLGLITREARRSDNGTRRSDMITLTFAQPENASGCHQQAETPSDGQPENASCNRKQFPPDNRKMLPNQPENASGIVIGNHNRNLREGERAGAPEIPPDPKPLSDDQLRAKLVARLPEGCLWPVRNALNITDIRRVLEAGADLDRHVLPAVEFEAAAAHREGRRISTWAPFVTAILARMEREMVVKSTPRLGALTEEWWRAEVRHWRKTGGQWSNYDVSEPPDHPKTQVPAKILAEFGLAPGRAA